MLTTTEPNTQFGYIEADAGHPFPDGASPIARFVEKPDTQTAIEYVESGRFFWNAGIFLMKASILLDEMRQFLPESLDEIVSAVAKAGSSISSTASSEASTLWTS